MLFLDLVGQCSLSHCLQCLDEVPPTGEVLTAVQPLLHHLPPPPLSVGGKVLLNGIKISCTDTEMKTKPVQALDPVLKVEKDCRKADGEEAVPE